MKSNSNIGLSGKYRIISYKKGEYEAYLKDPSKGKPEPLRVSGWHHNIVVINATRGLNILMRHLGGDTAISLVVSSGAIGTGSTAPTTADTALATPVLTGIDVARATVNTDNVVLEFFMTDSELANGTYNEFGVYVNEATEKLFARSLISPAHTKSAGEDTLVEYTITASSS
jgi:hypothetical protein